ncbi:hypothetical protein SKAU_G00028100 [Synaphobranchus kaupii]|uniref:Uncharacterized protein n=1 Tax=Synaphobranchus kaupii TaxID=118154 RepID=A0A9Q1JF83_SYNKA|nr:hypothetical protein SKAU_G00028100 [Synaphobranchus kaupii]
MAVLITLRRGSRRTYERFLSSLPLCFYAPPTAREKSPAHMTSPGIGWLARHHYGHKSVTSSAEGSRVVPEVSLPNLTPTQRDESSQNRRDNGRTDRRTQGKIQRRKESREESTPSVQRGRLWAGEAARNSAGGDSTGMCDYCAFIAKRPSIGACAKPATHDLISDLQTTSTFPLHRESTGPQSRTYRTGGRGQACREARGRKYGGDGPRRFPAPREPCPACRQLAGSCLLWANPGRHKQAVSPLRAALRPIDASQASAMLSSLSSYYGEPVLSLTTRVSAVFLSTLGSTPTAYSDPKRPGHQSPTQVQRSHRGSPCLAAGRQVL